MINNTKKGQAALEFLMTYGWAILAAIVVIAVLAIYFRPQQLVSSAPAVTAPFYAQAVKTNATWVSLDVKNNGADTVTISSFTTTFTNPSGAACAGDSNSVTLSPGQNTILNATGCTNLGTGAYQANVKISYTSTGSTLVQTSTGTISGSVSS